MVIIGDIISFGSYILAVVYSRNLNRYARQIKFKIAIEKAGSLGDPATLLQVFSNLIVRSYRLRYTGLIRCSSLQADLPRKK